MTRPDGSQLITYSNYIQATLLTDFVSGSDHWTNYYEYDADARQILHAHPSAVVSYDDGQADLDVTLRSSAGLLEITDYYTSTTATPTTPGGVEGYVQFTKVQQGTSGSPVKQSETTYFERTAGAVTIYPVAESTIFRHDDGTGGITTSFAYTWFTGTVQVEQLTTTLPVVTIGQNGTGVAATTTQIYDEYGNVQWLRDERGFITHRAYDWALGVKIQQIQDVDGTKLTLPSGWVTPVGGGLHLITDYDYDLLGRNIETLGPAHEVLGQTVRTASWTVYRDLEDETYSGQGYALGATGPYQYTLTNPVSIQRMSDNGLTQDSITAVRGCANAGSILCGCALPDAGMVESAGKLSASDCFPQSSWVRWSSSFSNKHGQLTASRTYHLIPASGVGVFGVNYDESMSGYDELNRQNRTVSTTGTINRTVYDVRGQVISSWIGTNDNHATDSDPTGGGAPGNNMVQITGMEYDNGSDGGDGNLTEQTAYVNAFTTRVTNFEYDFRNRRIVTDGELDFYQTTEYDNLSQTIRVDRRNTSSGGNLIARSETKFDNRGRVYQTIRYAVNPATGSVGNSLVDNTFYDASGNVVETRPSGSEAFTKSVYDGIARVIERYVGYTEGVFSSSSSSSSSSSGSGDFIFEQTETVYDAASNVIFVIRRQRFHDATGTGPLNGPNGPQPKSRDSFTAMWQDGIGRTIATANYGTNNNIGPPTRPELPPQSSNLILVSQTRYNERGEAFESIDPAGKVDRTYSDDAGRTVFTIQNYVLNEGCFCPGSEQNVTTEMRYGLGGQLAELIAKNQATGDQITRYEYGVTLVDSAIASNDLLRAEIYPDSQDSQDRVTYTYNRQGQRTSMRDQNGSVHEYEHDLLGRQTGDKVTTLGPGVDGAVLRIGTTYEVRGMVEKITSYSDTAGTTAVNEVLNVYNSFGQLKDQYQEHDGEVDTGATPKVQYAYADGSNNTIRPTGMTYPNGRELQYLYDDTHADKLSRIRTLKWDGMDVCQYVYLGLTTFVITDYLEPQVKLDYALGSGANPYTGFDQFGRIVDLLWERYGTSSSSSSSSSSGGPGNELVHLLYGYDQASNRTYREDLVAQSYNKDFDELYEYDGMQRLKKFHRGRLVDNNTAIESPTLQQGWHLDATGNWKNFTQNDHADATQTLDQQRVANQVNEITQIARTVGANWATPEYDRNGNMTVIPQPKDMTQTLQGTWDAWNRLVKLKELDGIGGWQNLAEYQYDGQTWRIVTKNYDSGVLDETRHFYFTKRWQDIEERLGTSPSVADAQQQYVWGLRYIDESILRDRDTDGNTTLDERLYAAQDGNWSVVAFGIGAISEWHRVYYDSFGAARFAEEDSTRWSILYTGQYFESNVHLYRYRFRIYHSYVGCFLSLDVLNLVNRFAYVNNRPLLLVDPSGLDAVLLNNYFLIPVGTLVNLTKKPKTVSISVTRGDFNLSMALSNPKGPEKRATGAFKIEFAPGIACQKCKSIQFVQAGRLYTVEESKITGYRSDEWAALSVTGRKSSLAEFISTVVVNSGPHQGWFIDLSPFAYQKPTTPFYLDYEGGILEGDDVLKVNATDSLLGQVGDVSSSGVTNAVMFDRPYVTQSASEYVLQFETCAFCDEPSQSQKPWLGCIEWGITLNRGKTMGFYRSPGSDSPSLGLTTALNNYKKVLGIK